MASPAGRIGKVCRLVVRICDHACDIRTAMHVNVCDPSGSRGAPEPPHARGTPGHF